MKYKSTRGKAFGFFVFALIFFRVLLADDTLTASADVHLSPLDGSRRISLVDWAAGPHVLIYVDRNSRDCLPCLKEVSAFKKFGATYPDVQFSIVFNDGDHIDTDTYLATLQGEWGVPGPVAADRYGSLRRRFNLSEGHKFLVFDRNGALSSVIMPTEGDPRARISLYHDLLSRL